MEDQLRTATPADLSALSEVYRRASLSNAGDREALCSNPKHLIFEGAHLGDDCTRVVSAGDRIVGFATTLVNGACAELEDLFVDPDWMRRGVARRLVADACVSARDSGCTRLEVTANPHAFDFYREVGFVGDATVVTELGSGLRLHIELPTASE